MKVEEVAQLLWSEDPEAKDSSWGFVNNKRRGEYRYQAQNTIDTMVTDIYEILVKEFRRQEDEDRMGRNVYIQRSEDEHTLDGHFDLKAVAKSVVDFL